MLRAKLGDQSINTVCESAHCPNIGECFSKQTLTFMILGDICSRTCAFCGVVKGIPGPIDQREPEKLVRAAKKLDLKYIVVTSVTRDDLADGGAAQFAKVISALHNFDPALKIEVLIPDLQGNLKNLRTILEAEPFVLNHNIETIKRLYPTIRPQAKYERSLDVISNSKSLYPSIYTKSGFMVGLGEEDDEVFGTLADLRLAGCDIVTIGQYLPPSKLHPGVSRYVKPEIFDMYREEGEKMGFLRVFSGPFVRSSYKAEEILCSQNNQKDY